MMEDFVKGVLTSWAIFLTISAIIWIFVEDDSSEKWFSRIIGAILCWGFVGVISAIQNKNKEEKI